MTTPQLPKPDAPRPEPEDRVPGKRGPKFKEITMPRKMALNAVWASWDEYMKIRGTFHELADQEKLAMIAHGRMTDALAVGCTWEMIGRETGRSGPASLRWYQRRAGVVPKRRANAEEVTV